MKEVDISTGKVLKSGWSHRISERLSRQAERMLQHPFVHGPNTQKIIKWLLKRDPKTAEEMIKSGIAELPKPRSRYTKKQLQRCKLAGVNLPLRISQMKAAWLSSNGDGTQFRNDLAKAGIRIKKGTKKNVYVATTEDEFELGPLDRLMKVKRLDISETLSATAPATKPSPKPKLTPQPAPMP